MVRNHNSAFRQECRAALAGTLVLAVAAYFSPVVQHYALPVQAEKTAQQTAIHRPVADFNGIPASKDARIVADWMVRNNKHHAGPFIIADKAGGALYAFDGTGNLIAKSPALYGKARSDNLTEAQAAKPIGELIDADKVTPAGLFYAKGVNTQYGRGIVLAEYATTRISIHQVVVGSGTGGRLGRLHSLSLDDRRVTFGCINATADFISRVVVPFFGRDSVIAVLPELEGAGSFFGIADETNVRRTVAALVVNPLALVIERNGGFYAERRRIGVQRG